MSQQSRSARVAVSALSFVVTVLALFVPSAAAYGTPADGPHARHTVAAYGASADGPLTRHAMAAYETPSNGPLTRPAVVSYGTPADRPLTRHTVAAHAAQPTGPQDVPALHVAVAHRPDAHVPGPRPVGPPLTALDIAPHRALGGPDARPAAAYAPIPRPHAAAAPRGPPHR
ncbi:MULTISPECIES: hypothetical protein [unclassified Streptomyces]|uniref:hypothetical protein n=1 Tax=unclassified Streptomyces TaxID=2593676 RepID=UPI0033C25B1A